MFPRGPWNMLLTRWSYLSPEPGYVLYILKGFPSPSPVMIGSLHPVLLQTSNLSCQLKHMEILAKMQPNKINIQANLEERKGNIQVPEIKRELKDRAITLCPDLMETVQIRTQISPQLLWGSPCLERQLAHTYIPTYNGALKW